MKRLLTVFLLIAGLNIPATVWAETQDVLIVEVQTETTASASEEYVIVSNNSSQSIDVSGWHLQYFSATAANLNTPSRSIALAGTLLPHDTFLAASSGYKTDQADISFGAGLAAAGGHIRLVSGSGADEVQHDMVGWGSALYPETAAVATAAKGQVYTRKSTNGMFIDSDNNASDFTNGSTVTPVPAVSEDSSGSDVVPVSFSTIIEPYITELLPDPAAPATDASGEFVELYNPNQFPIDLTGYKLQTGNTYSYSYTFKGGSLAPETYQAFYITTTKLTLSNTSGRARLLTRAVQM